jgi:hypothetical protein
MKSLFLAKLNDATHPMDLFVYWWRHKGLFEAELDLISAFSGTIDVSSLPPPFPSLFL